MQPPQSLHSRQLCYVCSVICVEKEILDKLAGGVARVSWEVEGGWGGCSCPPILRPAAPCPDAATPWHWGTCWNNPTQHSEPRRERELWETTTTPPGNSTEGDGVTSFRVIANHLSLTKCRGSPTKEKLRHDGIN